MNTFRFGLQLIIILMNRKKQERPQTRHSLTEECADTHTHECMLSFCCYIWSPAVGPLCIHTVSLLNQEVGWTWVELDLHKFTHKEAVPRLEKNNWIEALITVCMQAQDWTSINGQTSGYEWAWGGNLQLQAWQNPGKIEINSMSKHIFSIIILWFIIEVGKLNRTRKRSL